MRYFTWKIEFVQIFCPWLHAIKFLTNNIHYVNEECLKITGMHLIFVYFVKLKQTTKQPLRNIEPWKFEKKRNFDSSGLILVAQKKV